MTRTVTVKITESQARVARRAYGTRWLPFSWIAFHAGKVIATGVDRATRAETVRDIWTVFGFDPDVDVVVTEEGMADWPLRKAVTAS